MTTAFYKCRRIPTGNLFARTRTFASTPRSMVSTTQLSISDPSGSTTQDLTKDATRLVDEGRWSLSNQGAGLERHFIFKTFKATWDFMNEIAAECKQQKHHPEWTNVFNRTHIKWTTHAPPGLSGKDTHMARFCDEVAERYGEQWPDPQGVVMEGGSTGAAAECCGRGAGNKGDS